MSNLSQQIAGYAANFLKSGAKTVFPPAYLQAHPNQICLALFTSGGTDPSNTSILQHEVRANSQTKYVRKSLDSVWSAVFNQSDIGSTFPAGVALPASEKGFATIYNTQEIVWNDIPLAPWGTITHFAIILTQMVAHEGLTNGTVVANHAYANPHNVDGPRDEYVLMWGQFAQPKTVDAGNIFRFPIGAVQVNIY